MKRIVIKIGTSSLINSNGEVDNSKIIELVKEINTLKEKGVSTILVTSGAVAVGAHILNIKPTLMGQKQACAAVGQAHLMHEYDLIFSMYNINCAQILLNHDDFDSRKRVLNLENTINALIENDVVPIINENDALAVEEIKVGDNDTLSALIAGMVEAKLLVLISDIDGLYDKNPKLYDDAKLIHLVENIDKNIINMATDATTKVGTGGMITKIKAAKIATTSGVDMLIMNNDKINQLHNAFEEHKGTLFKASAHKLNAKSHWVLYKTKPKGCIHIDEGAKKAILSRGSLLPVGIKSIEGVFNANDIVAIYCENEMIAKGIVNYSSDDISKLKGHSSKDVKDIMGKDSKNVVIHANGIVLLEEE